MAIDDITITVDTTDYVYKPSLIQGSQVLRYDTEHGSRVAPQSLEISNQQTAPGKPIRFLVKFSTAVADTTDPTLISTGQVHLVATLPSDNIMSVTDMSLAYEKLRTFLTVEKFEELVSGSLI